MERPDTDLRRQLKASSPGEKHHSVGLASDAALPEVAGGTTVPASPFEVAAMIGRAARAEEARSARRHQT